LTDVHELRVFTAADGSFGNPLGVVLDGRAVAPDDRQGVAAKLGYSETVFVDGDDGEVAIFTPTVPLPFAGHPMVGTAWLLTHVGRPVPVLRPPAGDVDVDVDGPTAHVVAEPAWGPSWELEPVRTPAEVDATDADAEERAVARWAWLDQDAGVLRVRVFGKPLGVVEDEATGSAALLLGAALGRPITIHQGKGSLIEVAPLDDGRVRVGGRVVLDRVFAL
jgi:predicted PhzF superfamily epimerase YddE/YHI9